MGGETREVLYVKGKKGEWIVHNPDVTEVLAMEDGLIGRRSGLAHYFFLLFFFFRLDLPTGERLLG